MVAHQLKGIKRRYSVQSNRWKCERHFKCAQMCVFACHMVHREMKWCFATKTIFGILYSGENNFIDTIRFYGQNDVSHLSGNKMIEKIIYCSITAHAFWQICIEFKLEFGDFLKPPSRLSRIRAGTEFMNYQ